MVKQVSQDLKSTINERLNLIAIGKGIIVSYIVVISLFIIFAIILTYADFPERLISPAVLIATIISILVAGTTATKNLRSKGWLNGGIVGFIYMLFLYVLSSLVFRDFSIRREAVYLTLIGILSGSIGGIIGINVKRGSRTKYKAIKR